MQVPKVQKVCKTALMLSYFTSDQITDQIFFGVKYFFADIFPLFLSNDESFSNFKPPILFYIIPRNPVSNLMTQLQSYSFPKIHKNSKMNSGVTILHEDLEKIFLIYFLKIPRFQGVNILHFYFQIFQYFQRKATLIITEIRSR